MTIQHNPAEIARLIAEARAQYAATERQGFGVRAGTMLDLADQLEAAGREIAVLAGHVTGAMETVGQLVTERDKLQAELEATRQRIAALEAQAERNKLWSCPDCEFTFAAYHTNADGSISCPVCEAERMRSVVEAAEQWRGAVCNKGPDCGDGYTYHDHDCALNEEMRGLVDAVDAYRAARDKAGG